MQRMRFVPYEHHVSTLVWTTFFYCKIEKLRGDGIEWNSIGSVKKIFFSWFENPIDVCGTEVIDNRCGR